jgi:hypothetical protein
METLAARPIGGDGIGRPASVPGRQSAVRYVVVVAGPHPNHRRRRRATGSGCLPLTTRRRRLSGDLRALLARQQNRHRRGYGWQHTTVKAILENPRYAGFAIYGVPEGRGAAGSGGRGRRTRGALPAFAAVEDRARSREPAHPAIVSVATFTCVQLRVRRGSGAGSSTGAARAPWCLVRRWRSSTTRRRPRSGPRRLSSAR